MALTTCELHLGRESLLCDLQHSTYWCFYQLHVPSCFRLYYNFRSRQINKMFNNNNYGLRLMNMSRWVYLLLEETIIEYRVMRGINTARKLTHNKLSNNVYIIYKYTMIVSLYVDVFDFFSNHLQQIRRYFS